MISLPPDVNDVKSSSDSPIELTSSGVPLAVTRVYRSNMVQAKPGIFGYKWHKRIKHF